MRIKYERLEMQKYLKPNKIKINLEEAQEIFKLRSRVSEVKTNFKGSFENLNCDVCGIENETQKHIIECIEINKMKKGNEKPHDYDEIYSRNVEKQISIARIFLENIKIKKKIRKWKEVGKIKKTDSPSYFMGHVTEDSFFMSALYDYVVVFI